MLTYFCPHCNQKYLVPPEYFGQTIKCNSCCNSFTIVTASAKTQKLSLFKNSSESNKKIEFKSESDSESESEIKSNSKSIKELIFYKIWKYTKIISIIVTITSIISIIGVIYFHFKQSSIKKELINTLEAKNKFTKEYIKHETAYIYFNKTYTEALSYNNYQKLEELYKAKEIAKKNKETFEKMIKLMDITIESLQSKISKNIDTVILLIINGLVLIMSLFISIISISFIKILNILNSFLEKK